MPDEFYDGHEAIIGVSGATPSLIPRNRVQVGVNRQFRAGENRTRPCFQSLELEYPDDNRFHDNEKLFRAGNVQGMFFYNSYPSFLSPYLIVSIAGAIFYIEIRGRKGYVRRFPGVQNYSTLLHAWFAQGFEWLVIQDGASKPILWNGQDAPRRSGTAEVPIGSVMAFIHGRLAVCSADGTNQIAVGDIVYGSDATNTNDIIKFTETTYWSEGGAFGAPLFIGDVMFMQAMPFLDTGTGQNELVIVGREGGCSLDLSGPRATWKDKSVLRVSELGGGGVSSHGYCLLNSDLLFRADDGVRSYRNARTEFSQQWASTPISFDVRRYMGMTAGRYGQFCNMVSWANQAFISVSPELAAPNNPAAGFHRYHRGIVVLDADPQSNPGHNGQSVWQGLWTGIRPTAMCEGRINDVHRCFAMSYDQDGVNRLYEITPREDDDWLGTERKTIKSFYITGNYGVGEKSNNFSLKKLEGGMLQARKMRSEVAFEVEFAPNGFECFMPLSRFTMGCPCVTSADCILSSEPLAQFQYLRSAPENVPIPGTITPSDRMFHVRAKVALDGSATIDRLNIRFVNVAQDQKVRCEPKDCLPTTCCPYSDEFAYQISPKGVNTVVPTIPPPDTP